MDLRGFGESDRTFNTAGWKEAEDVRAAVEEFRRRVPITKLHVDAESLGASAALVAAGLAGRRGEKLIDGALLAVSPFSGSRREADYISTRPVVTSDFYMVQWFFLKLLRLGAQQQYKDFKEYLRDSARHYGVSVDELYDRSSPKFFIRDVNVPTILLHSVDDPVVPVDHADEFEGLLKDLGNPTLWRMGWGSHCLYELQDPDWFWTVLREFFDFYCILPQAAKARA
jgi:pimeloyl-ACP methyl ester carboxylesterase